MKFIIKHEIRGRMRVHLLQNRMTFEQADTLLYYLSSQKLVTGVKVREKTQDATINFVGDREEVIRALKAFHYETAKVPEIYLKNAEMQLEDDYGMIDGVVNNGAKDRKEKTAMDKAEKPSVVEQLKNQPHCEVRKKSTSKYAEQER